MSDRSKRYQKRSETVGAKGPCSLSEAVQALKKIDTTKFDESVMLDFQLGIRANQNDEMVRGTVTLPHGSGKKIHVVCICKGPVTREAEEAGADEIGAEELIQKIQKGWLDFDAIVAHPDMMRELSKLGRILGPRGLMPSPKSGTVTPNIGKAVQEMKAGKIEFKSDKTGGLHAMIGKLSFPEEKLNENARTLIHAVRDAKPAASKGEFLRRIFIAPTHGPGIQLSVGSI